MSKRPFRKVQTARRRPLSLPAGKPLLTPCGAGFPAISHAPVSCTTVLRVRGETARRGRSRSAGDLKTIVSTPCWPSCATRRSLTSVGERSPRDAYRAGRLSVRDFHSEYKFPVPACMPEREWPQPEKALRKYLNPNGLLA